MSDIKPSISTLSFVGFHVNSAIANGHLESVSFDELYTALEQGQLFEFLDSKLPSEFDFSLFKAGSDQHIGFHQVINSIAGGLQGRERKKLGLSNSNHGLSLLLAFILEALQHHDWV
ncbi:hypothetical protein [Photobacterium piscicola]|uniref:Uncharacterized protein n=1 Tax=Photobacterium piscicola TaxID=1378299 RepID=A0ABU6LLM0_9GAMM|nr:hypothetical protein [Photobacterium piscicola]